jgi:hypothetical protein
LAQHPLKLLRILAMLKADDKVINITHRDCPALRRFSGRCFASLSSSIRFFPSFHLRGIDAMVACSVTFFVCRPFFITRCWATPPNRHKRRRARNAYDRWNGGAADCLVIEILGGLTEIRFGFGFENPVMKCPGRL